MAPRKLDKMSSKDNKQSNNNKNSTNKYPMNGKQIILSCSLHFVAGFFLAKQVDDIGPLAQNIIAPWCGANNAVAVATTNTTNYPPRLRHGEIKAIAGEMAKEFRGQMIGANNPFETTTSTTTTEFHRIVQTAYQFTKEEEEEEAKKEQQQRDGTTTTKQKQPFNISTWLNSGLTTQGGLQNEDRILLGQLYSEANSVFEYGLGESTYLANYLNVPRYAGIDSDPVWVDATRNKVSPHYRFYFGDMGKTGRWGFPLNTNLTKSMLNYQLGPLLVEQEPFDVYMVDGRYRLPCALASFLHASARGGGGGGVDNDNDDKTKTIVLIHDCNKVKGSGAVADGPLDRDLYKQADHLLDMVNHSGSRLCAYKRKPETIDSQLSELWLQYARHYT